VAWVIADVGAAFDQRGDGGERPGVEKETVRARRVQERRAECAQMGA
jgi:hypothetical protein